MKYSTDSEFVCSKSCGMIWGCFIINFSTIGLLEKKLSIFEIILNFRKLLAFSLYLLIFPYISKKWLKLPFFGQKSTKWAKNWAYDPFIWFLSIFKILEHFAYFWPIFGRFLAKNLILTSFSMFFAANEVIWRHNWRYFWILITKIFLWAIYR